MAEGLAKFVGPTDVRVPEILGITAGFAEVLSAVSDSSTAEIQAMLTNWGLSEIDGLYGTMQEGQTFVIGDTHVTVHPIEGADDPGRVTGLIAEQLAANNKVALFCRSWNLITGYHEVDGKSGPFHAMNLAPDAQHTEAAHYVGRQAIVEMVGHAADNDAVYAFALSTGRSS